MSGSLNEKDNSEPETSKARKSTSDSVYSTEDSNNSRADASELEEDEFSQLKTKRSKRARCPPDVASDCSDDKSSSEIRVRKPSDSQYSSDDVNSPKKRNDSKRKIESEESDGSQIATTSAGRKKIAKRSASLSNESDASEIPKKIRGRKKKSQKSANSSEESDASEIPAKSRGRKKKTKRSESLSDDSDISEIPTKSRRKKKAKRSESLSDDSDDSEIPTKSRGRKKKTKESADSSEESEASEVPTTSKRTKKKVKRSVSSPEESDASEVPRTSKERKKKVKQDANSSEESDVSEIPTKCSTRKKKVKRSANSSEESDVSEILVKRKGRKKTIKSSASSSEESDASRIKTRSARSKKKVKKPSKPDSSDDHDSSQTQSGGSETEVISLSSEKSDQNSQWEANSSQTQQSNLTGTSGSTSQTQPGSSQMEESDESSNSVKEEVTPKKYKNVRIDEDSSDEDEVKKPKPLKKLPPKNVHLQRHTYKQLVKIIKIGNVEQIHDIIFGKTCDKLDLPEFSELLWDAVVKGKNGAIVGLMLVKAGVDVDLEGPGENSENTLLHVVAEKAAPYKKDATKFVALASLIMENGADINRCNGEGNSVLYSAVKGGSTEIIEELMRLDVELGERYNQVLRVAAERTDYATQILPLLIEYKVSEFDTKEQRAMYALRCLVKNGTDIKVMKVLLDYDLPLNELDNEGNTLLHRAVIDSNVEMVKLLLEYGADPRMKRKDDKLPLWHAARQPKSVITGLLIKHGASVHDTNGDIDRQYPIHAACNAGLPENIKLLLHFGANINVTDDFLNITPFATINGDGINDAHRWMILQFALLTSKNVNFDQRDLTKIRESSHLRKYYATCLRELESMKRLIIFEDISAHCILVYDIRKISHIINNTKLIDQYHESIKKIPKEFPTYSPVIRTRMKIAWSRRDRLNTIENAIKEATNHILPEEIYEKIAYFACYHDLMDFDLKEIPLCDLTINTK